MADTSDAFLEFDPILAEDDLSVSPWVNKSYEPNLDLLRRLMAVPIDQGHGRTQQSGRVAKSIDAWIAHELRRSGFPHGAVWPRATRPRVLPGDLAALETAIHLALERLDDVSDRLDAFATEAAAAGTKGKPPSLKNARSSIAKLLTTGKNNPLPGSSTANILGRFYVKQVDVAVSSWEHGPDVMISTKTQFSSYLNNKNNRYEEAVGEATNLRDRHPMAAMGFVYVVRSDVSESFAFAYLRDLLVRLRKPDGPFDATMLLAAEWDDPWDGVKKKEDREKITGMPKLKNIENATPNLSAGLFFEDLLKAVTTNTPVDRHTGVRALMPGDPLPGGLPPEEAALREDVDAALEHEN